MMFGSFGYNCLSKNCNSHLLTLSTQKAGPINILSVLGSRLRSMLKRYTTTLISVVKEKVYEFVRNIPRGKVATYGQIALHLGNRNFARAVGNIPHGNPDPEHIPYHRVVNAQGRLSRSYAFGGIVAQKRLLESERVVFKNDQVCFH